MQKTTLDRAPFFAALIGALSSLLALVLAGLMLRLHGNPAFLAIWLAAAFVITAYTRFNHRWLAAFRRMGAPHRPAAFTGTCRAWNREAEDVAFKDIKGTP